MIVEGGDGWALGPDDMAGERLEIGDHQLDMPFLRLARQPGHAPGSARRGDQVLGQGAPVAHAVVDVSNAQAENFGDFKALAQIAQAAVKRNYANSVAFCLKVRNYFLGAGGVAGTFAVDPVKNVGHTVRG